MYLYNYIENISVFFFKLLNYMLGFLMFMKSVVLFKKTKVDKLKIMLLMGKKP
jgi:hypothetical protein